MCKRIFVFLLLWSVVLQASAQDGLFITPQREAKKGLVLAFNGNFDIPAADMAKRFGISYRIGPSVFYKTKKNWLFGAKSDFILGGNIREEGFLSNMQHANGGLIGNNGMRYGVQTFERGYTVGLQAGKIIRFREGNNPDNGLMLLTAAGFIQHKILIDDKSGHLNQLRGENRKGYDRLANGLFIEQYAGYTHFSNNGLVNFHIGIDLMAGFTQGRRTYWTDVRKPGNDTRLDILFGIRGGWYIPIFKRKSEEFFFE